MDKETRRALRRASFLPLFGDSPGIKTRIAEIAESIAIAGGIEGMEADARGRKLLRQWAQEIIALRYSDHIATVGKKDVRTAGTVET